MTHVSHLASHRVGLGSVPGKYMWDLWCSKLQWASVFSKYFRFLLFISTIPPLLPTHFFIYYRRYTNNLYC
jgi:hypothetical protein